MPSEGQLNTLFSLSEIYFSRGSRVQSLGVRERYLVRQVLGQVKFYSLERAQSRDSCKASDWTTLNLAVKLLWTSIVQLSEGKILCKASVGSNHNKILWS